jgi:hypothetical protein
VAWGALASFGCGFVFLTHGNFSIAGLRFENLLGTKAALAMTSIGGLMILGFGAGFKLAMNPSKTLESVKLTSHDFCKGEWKTDPDGSTFSDDPGRTQYIRDELTGKDHLNQTKGCLRFKMILTGTLATAGHTLAMALNAIYRLGKILTLSHFRSKHDEKQGSRFEAFALDAARATLFPIAILTLFFISVYGQFDPREGKKLYTSVEKLVYGDKGWTWAPCFQPEATSHLLGGRLHSKYGF